MKKDFSLVFKKRGLGLLACFTAVAILLGAVLFRMQIFGYDEYQQKVLEQITVGSALRADRGNIYDRNGNLLAASKTTWRIYISPVDIRASAKKSGVEEAKAIARGLSEILGKDYETVYKKTQKYYLLDETIAKNVDKDTCDRVLRFAMENGYTSMVHVEATATRYYNYGNLAAQVIGFTGGDNQGLFGLELFYDQYLSGTDGQYITAKDASGKDLPSGYVGYTPAKDGLSLVTTLDLYIQKQLERVLADAAADSGAENRVSGIVIDVNNGGILAMATLPSYDLNDPYQLDSASLAALSYYKEGTEEYAAKKSELLYTMWNNKAITETYEPGSTFKIITSAMGLECGVVCSTSPFSCSGSYRVGGVLIHCHKVRGHGALNFTLGLQQSCNPVFMQVGARVGAEKFYDYFEAFGYLKKTGIDLPSETGSIFHSLENIHDVELATASFGQRFNVSMIQQIAAVAAVANGGKSVTPHLMERLVNEDGTSVLSYTQKKQTQIVSQETCNTINKILEEGVSGGNGVKNAYVCGYKIAAKTGTSEKLNGKRIGSCVAYAPADDPEIAVIIIVDEPTCTVKYGSVIAAPYVADLMKNVLPYMGYSPQYTEEEAKLAAIPVGDYTGLPVADAIKKIKALGLSYEYGDGGSGDTVCMQVPASGAKVSQNGGKVILYTEENAKANVKVPDLLGKSGQEASRLLTDAGLNLLAEGAIKYDIGEGATVVAVSYEAGAQVPRGTVITITLRYLDGDESG